MSHANVRTAKRSVPRPRTSRGIVIKPMKRGTHCPARFQSVLRASSRPLGPEALGTVARSSTTTLGSQTAGAQRQLAFPPVNGVIEHSIQAEAGHPGHLFRHPPDICHQMRRLLGRRWQFAETNQLLVPDLSADRLDNLPDPNRKPGSDVDRPLNIA